MNILERISCILEEKGYSQTELSNYIGIHPNNFVNWKRRNTLPPIEIIPLISEFLNVSISYLVKGEEEKYFCDYLSEVDMSNDSVINRLLYILNLKDIKAADFYKNIGITSSTFMNWKRGKATPPLNLMPLISETLEVPLSFLISGKEDLSKNVKNIEAKILSDPALLGALDKYFLLPDEDKKEIVWYINARFFKFVEKK